MSVSSARSFLDAIQGADPDPAAKTPSANRPNRLAVVEEAYSSGLVHVRFEGEEGVGTKGYASLGNYNPQPGDRVVMVPVGTSYVILDKVDPSPRQFPEWHDVTPAMLANGWEAYDINDRQAKPEYIRTGDGWVKVKGLLRYGATENEKVVLTLPEGYRPTGQLHFPTVSNYSTIETLPPNVGNDRAAMLRVRPNGEVSCGFGVGVAWLSLDSLTFVAES